MKLVILLVFACLCAKSLAQSEYRLNSNIVPSHYDIQLTISDSNFEVFQGVVKINVNVQEATSEIVLHAAPSLTFVATDVTLQENGTNTAISVTAVTRNNATELVTVKIAEAFKPNAQLQLTIQYSGVIFNNQMYGLYRSYYKEGGAVKYLATTQFQPTHARKAFPCFDEPGFKATFDIQIGHPFLFTAVSNMPEVNVQVVPINLKTTKFATTPRMSTYLIAFIISEFKSESGVQEEPGIAYNVWSRHQNETELTRQYAVEIGPKMLRTLADFTGLKYGADSGMKKMDQFAIPDFSAGAMENWGIVTYRETGLLWHPNISTNANKQSIAAVIAHEFAHNWFGNLVTCHWWSDTFLNEGFARYFQYFATGAVEPTWEMDKQFVVAQCQAIFQSDALSTALPLSHPETYTPSEVSNRFASISYNKGACVIRMVETFLGHEGFRAGLRKYLAANKHQVTTPAELIKHWQGEVDAGNTLLAKGTNLTDILTNWIERPGFPVLVLHTHDGVNLHLEQERYLSAGTDNRNTTWHIPISYTTSNDLNKFQDVAPRLWMAPGPDGAHINGILNSSDWIIFNNQQRGYFRVDYGDDLWNRIGKALQKFDFDGIHELNRAQLVDDLFNLARIGKYPHPMVLSFIDFLRKDTSYYSWNAAFTSLSHIWARTADVEIRSYIADVFIGLMEVVYNTVPFDVIRDDDQIFNLKKALVLSWACRLGQPDCIKRAQTSFENYRLNGIMPDRNVKTVYCNGLRYSNNAARDWQFLWGKYEQAELAAEQVAILSALGCSRDVDVIKGYLATSIDPNSGIRQQDALSVFSSVYGNNPEGVDIALDFLHDNHENVGQYYGSMNSLNNLASGLAGSFTKQEQIDKFAHLASMEGTSVELQTAINTALVAARSNLAWTVKFEQELALHLRGSSANIVGISLSLIISLILGTMLY